jgi:hypothetical protein
MGSKGYPFFIGTQVHICVMRGRVLTNNEKKLIKSLVVTN